MLQREVSDSTWKETERQKKEQSLYQQTVAIGRPETSGHGERNPTRGKTQDLRKARLQNGKKGYSRRQYLNKNEKITQNNNWAPSKIRLRFGAEVDKN